MKLIVSIFLLVVLFFGCKKYPEDEQFLHLKRPGARIGQYTLWRLTQYTVDGADSIPYINSKVWSGFPLDKVEFDFKHFDIGYIEFNGINPSSEISMKFADKKKRMTIAFFPGTIGYSYPLFLSGWNSWDIRKLEKGVFIIEINKNSKVYRIKFEKI
jgi:hypothetical protein